MAQPAPPPPAVYPAARSPWYLFRLLAFIGAVCEFIAALVYAGIATGPGMAWVAGGIAAFFLAWAIP